MSILKFFCRRYSKTVEKMYIRRGKIWAKYYSLVVEKCGENFKCYGKPIIYKPHLVQIGANVTINNNAEIAPHGRIIIGDNVTISRGVQIVSGGLNTKNWVSGNYLERKHVTEDVFIGEGTWMGLHSMLLPGVKITGKGVVVAAGAVVTKDITEDFIVVAGVPAKKVKDLKEIGK